MANLAAMRRFRAFLVFAALAALLAGCGGGSKAVSPLDDALGYFPKDAPFVATVQTDPNGQQLRQLRSLLGSFLGSDPLLIRLQNFTRLRFVDYARDVRPQLGGPLVIGLERPAAGKGLAVATVVAMRIKHPTKAKQVLLRQPGFRGHGKASGVRIYEDTTEARYVAVDGHVLVASANREMLEHALALKRTDNRMRESGFDSDVKDLPSGGVARVSADPRMMIGADARFRPALNVKWISAMRRLGAVLKAGPSGLTLDLRLATDSGSLSDHDLPLDPQPSALPLIGKPNELQIATRQPERLARLGFAIWHAIAPLKAAAFDAGQPRGVDLERQLPHHLAEPATFTIDPTTKSFAFRTQLNEAADVRNALAALAPKLPDLATFLGVKTLGVGRPTAGENFYALAKPNGGLVVFGVVGNAFVAASDPRRASGLASQPTHSIPGGAKGAAVITLDARNLVGNYLVKQVRGLPRFLAPLLASSLRDLTGTLTIDRSALRGHFKLTIVK